MRSRWTGCALVLVGTFFAFMLPVHASDLRVTGKTVVIDEDTEVDGSVLVEDGGVLIIRGATLTLRLEFDEEHSIQVSENSRLEVEDGVIDSTGGQYYIDIDGSSGHHPKMEVRGESWITNHSGIRPAGDARVTVSGGDVEELQVRDRVVVNLSNAAVYPVFFFDGVEAAIQNLRAGSSVSNTISIPGGWSFTMSGADVEEYQIDLENGASVTLDGGDGIVLSLHTPGTLGTDLRIVEGVTSHMPASGMIDDVGTRFAFTNSTIVYLNLYTVGRDRVLVRNAHVNEVNAGGESEVVVGERGYSTLLNCNLCQVYDRGSLTIVASTIDDQSAEPSATASYADTESVGRGTIRFVDTDVRNTELTALQSGTIVLDNSPSTASKISILDGTATVVMRSIAAGFTSTSLSGDAPLSVEFIDLSGGSIDSRLWNFGDGTQSTEESPHHTFRSPGTYTVSLTVRGAAGESTETRSAYIEVGGDAIHRRRAVRRPR